MNLSWNRVALCLIALLLPIAPGAAAQEIRAPLPPGATLLQQISGDTDGDGQADSVTLYSVRPPRGGPLELNIAVLRSGSGATAQLFGDGLEQPRSPPAEGHRDARIALWDLNGDGPAEIVLSSTTPIQGRTPDQSLWIFRWNGLAYRIEAALRGSAVEAFETSSGAEGGIHVRKESRWWALGGMDGPTVATEETYRWRADGYRLSDRALRFVQEPATPATPEQAVLLYYQAIDRGDYDAAYNLATQAARARRSYDEFAAGFADTRSVQVEEIRRADDAWMEAPEQASVSVRLAALDEGEEGLTARTYAGTWRLEQWGERWELAAARIAPAPALAAVAQALPGGSEIERMASGDLRGTGQDDLVVAATPPGRFFPEAYLLMVDGGVFQGLSLRTLVPDAAIGDHPGDLRIEDVNADGRAELVFGGGAGAHGSMLAVLRWEEGALVPLFSGATNTPGLSLVDIDPPGASEIVYPVSGYCGSYAGSPHFVFLLSWREDAYRPATADLVAQRGDDLFEFAEEALAAAFQDSSTWGVQAQACIQHMQALGHATGGRALNAWEAYQRYHEVRLRISEPEAWPYPVFVGDSIFEDEVRELLARALNGRLGSWEPRELAVLHDMLGNSAEVRAMGLLSRARWAERDGRLDEATAYRQEAVERAATARREYEAALGLEPDDREARAALQRLSSALTSGG